MFHVKFLNHDNGVGQIGAILCLLASLFLFLGCDSTPGSRRLKWNIETTVEVYEEFGRKDEKWNTNAVEALSLFARWRAENRIQDEALAAKIATASKAAVDAGCKDGMVLYIYARFSVNKSGANDKAISFAHKRAADALKDSEYPKLRKAYANIRAAESLYRLKPPPKLDIAILMNDAAIALGDEIRDGDTPEIEIYQAARAYLHILESMPDVPGNYGAAQMQTLLRKKYGDNYRQRLVAAEITVD